MGNKFEMLARFGYAARGVVYGVLGALALMGSLPGAGGEASTQGAFSALLGQPFGRILLGAVAVGLLGHVLWRFAQSILDADHQGTDLKGIGARVGSFASGAANLSLAIAAASLVLAGGGGGGSQGEDGLTAWLMQQPFGRILVGAVGVGIMVAGAIQVWSGISGRYRKRVKLPAKHEAFLHPLSAFGLSARGVLLAITGGFFAYAALTVNPEQAGGITEGLDWVQQLPFGPWLYALAAAGLVAFGLYSFIEARYRQVDAPDAGDLKRAADKVGAAAGRG